MGGKTLQQTNNMNTDSKMYIDELNEFARNWKILIDTSSIMEKSAKSFFNEFGPLLRKYQNYINFPASCFYELHKHSLSSHTIKASLAKTAINLVSYLQKMNILIIRGNKNDGTFADPVFLEKIIHFRTQYNILVITQDNNLAKDIQNLNLLKSVKGYKVDVRRIDSKGQLINFSKNQIANMSNMNNMRSNISQTSHIPPNINITDDSAMIIHSIPSTNDIVGTDVGGSIVLTTKIAEGGEGIIYNTNTQYVAKIYKSGKITNQKFKKIQLMLATNMKYPGICYPVGALYNKQHEFVGYLMPKAAGIEIQKSIFIKPQFIKIFPNWKKIDTVELCLSILTRIKFLHDNGIIIGDINPMNILVKSPTEVYFVDTDSYQIGSYPCPVGTVNFTAPEIQGIKFSSFLRTMGNENFAIATLMFMIMLPGKTPYAQQGGENPIENILNMDFSYPLGENSNKKTPDGPWRFIWSHLSYRVKQAFYETFTKNGKNSTEETRLSTEEWIAIFNDYKYRLESGQFKERDPMSEELYPTRYKNVSSSSFVKCKLCRQLTPEDQTEEGICFACLQKTEAYQCRQCGKTMFYTNRQKYIFHTPRYELCHDCYIQGQQVKERRICISCGKEFEITNSEYEFYASKKLTLPKRCHSCRNMKREENIENEYDNSKYENSYSNESSMSFKSKQMKPVDSIIDKILNFIDWFI